MNIAGAFDVHHPNSPFDRLDTVTGEEEPAAGAPPDREHLRAWLARFAGQAGCGVHPEGCTGWLHVAEGPDRRAPSRAGSSSSPRPRRYS
jgi:hypothetical protein